LTITTIDEQQATFCTGCGQKNNITSKFCESCGAKLLDEQIGPAKKTVKRIPKKLIVAVGLAASVVILAAALFTAGNAITDPSNIAEKYFLALADSDYEKAFEYLAIDESEFINKDAFCMYMAEGRGILGKLSSYKITDTSQLKNMNDILGMGQISAVFAGSLDEEEYYDYYYEDDNNGLKKTFLVEYKVNNGRMDNFLFITLQKNDNKKLLFFDDYDVSADGYLVYDVVITVPAGSTVAIDDKELIESEDVNVVSETFDRKNKDIDTYTISEMFPGSHILTVENVFYEDYTEKIKVSGSGNQTKVSTHDLILKESLKQELAKRTEADYTKICNSAIAGREFSALEISCTDNQKKVADIKRTYDRFTDDVIMKTFRGGVTGITFNKFISARDNYLSQDITYRCSMKVNCDYTLAKGDVDKGTWREVECTDRDLYISITYAYEDNAWVIQDFALGFINLLDIIKSGR